MNRESLAIPAAIVIAAGLIAGAIYWNGAHKQALPANGTGTDTTTGTEAVRPLDSTDHVRGNPNAPIVMIEYSDFDCPYCKLFHETMQQVMTDYGDTGKVAWVYRHLPIKQLHPNAPKLAEASECVSELGGNEAFWKFADIIFGSRQVNEQTNMAKLPDYAAQAGVDKNAFNTCFASGKYAQKVTDSINEFVKVSGGKIGTPHTFILVGDQSASIEGAQPYSVVKGALDSIIGQMNGQKVPTDTTNTPTGNPPVANPGAAQ